MKNALIKDAVLRVGEVIAVEGRKVYVLVDKNKNSSDLLLDGDIIKNISVGSYIEIRKGFLSLIGKIDGEKLKDEKPKSDDRSNPSERNHRILAISMSGYIDHGARFIGGIKELPLIGNEAFILTEKKIQNIHALTAKDSSLVINVASTDIEGIPITLPIDGLFNSHIAIFGNTGSGKSNTLAALYQGFFQVIKHQDNLKERCKFLFFDFNGEYTNDNCLTAQKTVYYLSTHETVGSNKIPVTFDDIFNIETLSVLMEATEKTQKPFLKRALRLYKSARSADNFFNYTKSIIQNKVLDVLKMTDKGTAYKLLDYLETVIHTFCNSDTNLREKLDFHNVNSQFIYDYAARGNNSFIGPNSDSLIKETLFYKTVQDSVESSFSLSDFDGFYVFLHIQLISDLYRYKVQNDHIYPVVNRIKAKQKNIESVFEISPPTDTDIWGGNNVIVVSLRNVNLDMRKTIPLLLAKEMYARHKKENSKTLNIIVDEAHNILSKASFRETSDWKDYRLETFEEIIKEGRKFGVFLTISSQRPNDISETIISQAHNYFIHQLINQRDLLTIGNAVSYIDKVTEESIPTLPVGTCIFSGVASSMPLKLKVMELPDEQKPESHTLKFEDLMCDDQPSEGAS